MTRIKLDMTLQDAVMKMSNGNPGSMTVMMQMIVQGEKIDPDNLLGGFGNVLDLDTNGIYGEDIWLLYKDLCGQDLIKTISVLRAIQLGIIPEIKVKNAIESCKDPGRVSLLDVDNCLHQVQERLPSFGQV